MQNHQRLQSGEVYWDINVGLNHHCLGQAHTLNSAKLVDLVRRACWGHMQTIAKLAYQNLQVYLVNSKLSPELPGGGTAMAQTAAPLHNNACPGVTSGEPLGISSIDLRLHGRLLSGIIDRWCRKPSS